MPAPNWTTTLALVRALGEELKTATQLARSTEVGFGQRLLVRVFFSVIEALLFRLKIICLELLSYEKASFSAPEMAVLREVRVRVVNGVEEEVSWFPPFEENLRVTLRCYSRSRSASTPPPIPDTPLKAVVSVRNRLTHPKDVDDLALSQQEREQVGTVFSWFSALLKWHSDTEIALISRYKAELNESVAAQIRSMNEPTGGGEA